MPAIDTYSSWTAWIESGDWTSNDTAMPMLPAMAGNVMTLALDPDVSISRISAVVSKDQVLATRVLRLANSAHCGPMEEITTINDAAVRMGTTAVRNVVLAVCLSSRLREANIYGPMGRALLDHGVGTACLAQQLALRVRVDPDEAFLYGLLHDLGKLVLLKLAKDFVQGGGTAPTDDEMQRVMAERHATIGGLLMRKWQLPRTLEEPVMFHHDPAACERFPKQATVAYGANRLSHRYGFGCRADKDVTLVGDPLAARIDADEAWMADLDQKAAGLFSNARDIIA
jgi:putative nucleotidyltransferase with HDIG domain